MAASCPLLLFCGDIEFGVLRCAHTFGIIRHGKGRLSPKMARQKKIDGGSRHGKHAPDVFRVSLYLSAEEKAIAILTAEIQQMTLSDVFRNGIVSEATRTGIIANGLVTDKFRTRVNAYKHVLEAEIIARRG